MAFKLWVGSPTSTDWTTPSNWSPRGVPVSGDFDIIQNGTPVANNLTIDGQSIWLSNAGGLDLKNSQLGPASSLYLVANTKPINVELNNAALRGRVYAQSGADTMTVDANSFATNLGTMAVFGGANDSLSVVDNGSFANAGTMAASANGIMAIKFTSPTATTDNPQTFVNTGTIEAFRGGSDFIHAPIYGLVNGQSSGLVLNEGTIDANGGTVTLQAKVVDAPQAGSIGKLTIENNGAIVADSGVSNGTITIQSGMLNLGPKMSFSPGPPAALALTANVDFTGTSGMIAFNTPGIADTFDLADRQIFITAPFEGNRVTIADIHLGSARPYTANEFTINSTGDLVFHAPTTS